jgi:4-hydroxy-tetrahydrodipicolinate synthase
MIQLTGVYAALLTPRHPSGDLDIASYRNQIAALNTNALTGYAINGATGEFTIGSAQELERLLAETRDAAPQAQILCGIGANDLHGTIRLGRLAAAAGAAAALLPMPAFFPYRQDDLYSFASSVASEVDLPVLLYNLPQFTSALHVETVLSLLSEHPNIIGIKDSSGSLDIVRAITKAGLPSARLIGNDAALAAALDENVCDGVISGVACTLPELMTAMFVSHGDPALFANSHKLLDEFIEQLGVLPTPWGLKVTSAARGYTRDTYPLPLSGQRRKEIAGLRSWFLSWYKQTLLSNAGAA